VVALCGGLSYPAAMLAAYLARLGHSAAILPTLATVTALHRAHVEAIPFENLDVLVGRRPSLTLDDIVTKLVHGRRGGYCFEQNSLFRAVLEQLGVPVTLLMARVRFGTQSIRPRTHTLLRIEIEGRSYIADVGFGGWGLSVPLRLDAGVERHDGLLSHRLMKTGDLWVLQARLDEGWADLYAFTLEPYYAADLEMANHYVATYPDSLFRHHLVAQRIRADRRLMLRDGILATRTAAGTDCRQLDGADAVANVLLVEFGITTPAGLVDALVEGDIII